jgi:N6-L-threonylcarbamoyladenine synthase
MIVLGIETSCDETAAAVVEDGYKLLSNVVASSMDLHKVYGGVVPEIAARSHIESIIPVIDEALQQAMVNYQLSMSDELTMANGQLSDKKSLDDEIADPWDMIDAIAVTYGAGLGGSLLVGVMTARTLAITKNKPLYAANHVHGHVAANFLTQVSELSSKRVSERENVAARTSNLEHRTSTWQLGDQTYMLPIEQPQLPLLALIVSGGHTQLVLFQSMFDYVILGKKRDDAIGEAFDKVAKIIGLPYPGGPSIAEAAKKGDPHKYKLPKARLTAESNPKSETRNPKQASPSTLLPSLSSYDFSFSGLKTAVLRLAQDGIGEDFTFPSFRIAERLSETQKHDIAASFECIALETVVDKTLLAFKEFAPKSVVIAGGVAASQELRRQLSERLPIAPHYTDIKLCTDNGAMIAALGCFMALEVLPLADPYSLDISPSLSM